VKKTFIENLSKKFWKNFWEKIPPFWVVYIFIYKKYYEKSYKINGERFGSFNKKGIKRRK
jgi:hypothetical protein